MRQSVWWSSTWCVNGVNYKIRRGVEVEVPPEVAEVLEHSQMQDELTAARIAAAENAAQ